MNSQTVFKFPQDPAIPNSLVRDVLAKLAYLDERVDEATISGDGVLVTISLRGKAEAGTQELLAGRVRTIVGAMTNGVFAPPLRVVEERSYEMSCRTDPMPDLLTQGEVVPEGPGCFMLGPILSKVIDYFESRLLDVAQSMQAAPFRFPALIPAGYMEKVKYFQNFPHSLTFATHLRENLPDIEKFSCEAVTKEGRIDVARDVYASAPAILAPTVCHHLYFGLNGRRLPATGMTVTASGHCFRYESRNMRSLERLWDFTMREIIFVGTSEFVRSKLDECRERIRPILADFKITHTVMTASDPFFIGTFRDQAAYQAAFELKHEIRAALPYKNDTLAIGSFNRHSDFFGRTLDIRLEDGSAAHTGCVGIGFERLVLAFVAQHGTDPADWPRSVRNAVGSPA